MPVKPISIFVAAWLSLIGVLLGMVGTYLMTTAYHPFKFGDLFLNMLGVLLRLITFQWRSAIRMVQAVAKAGDALHKERKDLSLLGINLLFASFLVQAVAAIFTLWYVFHY